MQELKVKDQEKILNAYRFGKRGKRSKIQAIIERFMESEDIVRELKPDPGEYKSNDYLHSAQSSICKAVKRSGYDIHTFREDGRLYIIKGAYVK